MCTELVSAEQLGNAGSVLCHHHGASGHYVNLLSMLLQNSHGLVDGLEQRGARMGMLRSPLRPGMMSSSVASHCCALASSQCLPAYRVLLLGVHCTTERSYSCLCRWHDGPASHRDCSTCCSGLLYDSCRTESNSERNICCPQELCLLFSPSDFDSSCHDISCLWCLCRSPEVSAVNQTT